jgi:WD40 repeat protein
MGRAGRSRRVLRRGVVALTLEGRAALASGSLDGGIRLWDAASGKRLRALEGHEGYVTSLTPLMLDGGPALASGSDDGAIRLWDAASGKLLRTLEGHRGYVNSLAPLTLDGRPALASASLDGAIRLWDAASGEQLGRLVVWMGLAAVTAGENMTRAPNPG